MWTSMDARQVLDSDGISNVCRHLQALKKKHCPLALGKVKAIPAQNGPAFALSSVIGFDLRFEDQI